MIVLPKEDLRDQAGMERAIRWYFDNVEKDPESDGTFNTMLACRFERCDYEKSTLVLSMQGRKWMSNPLRMLHGGVTAAALDMCMGLLSRYCTGGYMTPTVDMSVSFLRPGPCDGTVYIEAQVTKRGFSICHAVSRMWAEGEENAPLATASASYYVTHKAGK